MLQHEVKSFCVVLFISVIFQIADFIKIFLVIRIEQVDPVIIECCFYFRFLLLDYCKY